MHLIFEAMLTIPCETFDSSRNIEAARCLGSIIDCYLRGQPIVWNMCCSISRLSVPMFAR